MSAPYKQNLILVLFSGVVVLTACTKAVELKPTLKDENITPQKTVSLASLPAYVPNEVLVKFKDGSTARGRGSVLESIGGVIKEEIHISATEAKGEGSGIFLVQTPMDVKEAIARLQATGSVEYAEPNGLYYPQQTSQVIPTDPEIFKQWGLISGPFSSNASLAWNRTTGDQNLFVGVIDEGMMYSHEDLLPNCGNALEIDGNRKDDDGNGFVDDTYGWDFIANDKTVFDGVVDDHGTHVAGIIGAVGNNAKGVAGMNWRIKMLNAKFLGTSGNTTMTATSSGSAANLVKAISYFNTLATKLPIVAINNSYAGMTFSQSVYNAIEAAGTKGILFVASVGNDSTNFDGNKTYPAGYANSNIIRVTAITQNGTLFPRSSWGTSWVDIGAPGDNILSTIPISVKGKLMSGYGNMSGSSQATAFVTGAVALFKAANPLFSSTQIKTAILNYARKTSTLVGVTGAYGATLDINNALNPPVTSAKQ